MSSWDRLGTARQGVYRHRTRETFCLLEFKNAVSFAIQASSAFAISAFLDGRPFMRISLCLLGVCACLVTVRHLLALAVLV